MDKIPGTEEGMVKAPGKAHYIALSQWDKRKKNSTEWKIRRNKIILIYLSR